MFIFRLLFVSCFIYSNSANLFKNFDDSVLFSIKWSGHNGAPDVLSSPDYEKMELISAENEKFHCYIPINYGEVKDDEATYKGPDPLTLLLPTLKSKSCSHSAHPYWSYELCHGDKIIQTNKKIDDDLQEHNLGNISPEQLDNLIAASETNQDSSVEISTGEVSVNGISTPYLGILYSDGSLCAITNIPRATLVMYVCYENARNILHSVFEKSTCLYDIIVLNNDLCAHPKFNKAKASTPSPIHCMPNSALEARKPRQLLVEEAHSLKLRMMPHLQQMEESLGDFTIVSQTTNEDGSNVKIEYKYSSVEKQPEPDLNKPVVDGVVESFLAGEDCLEGGEGHWWKFKFCYGKTVSQYHVHKDQSETTTIVLGNFNYEKHVEWLKKNPSKKPKKTRMHHYYTDGAVCDVTGQPRTVDVVLRCPQKKDVKNISIWLIEPQPCFYKLTVEAEIICKMLENADEWGMQKTDGDNLADAEEINEEAEDQDILQPKDEL